MIEPGAAAHSAALARARELALHGQLDLAVVVAGVARLRSLAAEAAVALQQQRLRRREGCVQGEACGVVAPARGVARAVFACSRGVARAAAFEPPVADVHMRVVERSGCARRLRVAAPAREALGVQQAALGHVGQRGVREQQLACGEAALDVLRKAGARAEEGQLEAPSGCVVVRVHALKPAGDVPPLDAEFGMRAVIARKDQRARCRLLRACRQRAGAEPCQQGAPRPLHHQSAFTAAITSRPAAARAASAAVRLPATSTPSSSAPMRAQGTSSSMVQ